MNAPAAIPLDDLARALDRARAAHERRPDDHRLYVAMLEAEVAFLKAELDRRSRAIGLERRRATEIARRLSAAREVSKEIQQCVQPTAGTMSAQPAARTARRKRQPRPAGVPLLDFAGLSA